MSIVLNTTTRKAMSRTIVELQTTLFGLQISADNTEKDRLRFIEDDELGKEFMDLYHINIGGKYETEKEHLSGDGSGTFTETDIEESAQFVDTSLFYPIDPPPPYTFLIPKIVDEVNGGSGSFNSLAEQPSIDNYKLYAQFIDTGFFYGGFATTTSVYNPGSGTLNVTANTFNDGDYIYTTGAIFEIISGGGTAVLVVGETVAPLLPIPTTTSMLGNFSGFTNSERETMIAGDQNVLDGLSTLISSNVTNWQTALTTQIVAINTNDEERPTQQSQLAAASTNSNSTLSIVNSWVALPLTGVGARNTDTGLAILNTEVSLREPIVTSRVLDINIALGTVIDNGDGTFSGTDGDIYYERYRWLDSRLNKIYGSAIDKYQKNDAKNLIQGQLDNAQFEYDRFSQEMAVTQFFDDSEEEVDTIVVDDSSIFTETDVVYILSETISEITREIIFIDSNTNAITFNTPIPAGYLLDDLARVFKLL